MDRAIDKQQTALSTKIPSTFDEKTLNSVTQKKVYAANVYQPKINTARAV